MPTSEIQIADTTISIRQPYSEQQAQEWITAHPGFYLIFMVAQQVSRLKTG